MDISFFERKVERMLIKMEIPPSVSLIEEFKLDQMLEGKNKYISNLISKLNPRELHFQFQNFC